MTLSPHSSSKPGLRRHLQAGGGLSLFWLSLGSEAVVELAEPAGADAVVLDLQHGLWDRRGLEAALRPNSAAPYRLVRLADHDRFGITSALDASADGVIAPLVETPAQAQAIIAAARYQPFGGRSVGGVRPLSGDLPQYVAAAEDRVAVGVMIETLAGLAAVDEIAAVPGLDFIFIGAGDLSLCLGEFPKPGPQLPEALAKIQAACQAAGIACGIYSYSGEDARARRDQGFAITVVQSDIGALRHGFASAMASFKG